MQLGLDVGDDDAWFWRRRPGEVIGWLGDEEGRQFMLSAMIRVVRATAGPQWLPPHIRLESSTARWTASVSVLADCQIRT